MNRDASGAIAALVSFSNDLVTRAILVAVVLLAAQPAVRYQPAPSAAECHVRRAAGIP